MSNWLNKLTTKDGKLAPTTNGKPAKPGSRSVSPAPTPNLPKINLPPLDGPNYGYGNGNGTGVMPKVVLTQDDEEGSPMTVSPNSVHRADSMSPSQDSLGKSVGNDSNSSHRRFATIANDDIPSRTRVQSEALPPPPTTAKPRSRSNSVANGDQNVVIPITESPTQSVTSRRSGSIGSGESTQYPSIQQLVESPKSDKQQGLGLVPVITDAQREANGSPQGKNRKNSRKHAASVGAASVTSASSRFGKPPSRHQSAMGMGLASALAASGMGIAPPPSMLVSATGGLAPPAISKKASNVSMSNGRQSPERTRIFRPRRRSSGQSAANGNNSGDDSEDYDSGDALSFNDDEIPITGFAVATMKRNQDFHELFPQVPADDYLIDDYGCALQRDILIQGRLYISENHLCFHANIFGWVTDVIIPVGGIIAVEKKMTAFVIPNAISIQENATKHTFASFLARDTAYDVIYSVWRNGGPSRSQATSPGSDETPGLGSLENGVGGTEGARLRKATQCACSKAGQHYPNVAMDMVLPGTPEQIYNLMFASGFIKDFWAKDQGLLDIQTSDWQPSAQNQHLLSRNMSYIKPLSGGFGPKQTKCELNDENQHVDFNDYATTITTTRTPDVPSGSVFSVKTRTCVMWAGNSSTKVVVTFTVEWTGKSFIKGIIERSCSDGQRTYYSELQAAMRKYITEHRTEFLPEGVDPAAAVEEQLEEALSPTTPHELQPTGPKPVATSRGLQWALDTFEAASKVATDSISGLFDIVSDLLGGAGGLSRTSILGVVIALLIASNIYTIMTVGERRESGRRQAIERKETERERWVGDAVKAFIQAQQSLNHLESPVATVATGPGVQTDGTTNGATRLDVKKEIEELRRTVTQIEERVASLKLRLEELD